MTAYYNDNDPYAAQFLRNLIAAGHIAPGFVDERSISDVKPSDLAGFTQCHFFAGIGACSLALRRAGWPDNRPIWTGSCPCQPFSAAGKGNGFADERHLWPHWFHLIEQCSPSGIFGEQVASKDGLEWLDLVQTDLEATGYAFVAQDRCAAGSGAPHIRQRLYFFGMDDATGTRRFGSVGNAEGSTWDEARLRMSGAGCETDRLADADSGERERIADGQGRIGDGPQTGRQQSDGEPQRGGEDGRSSPLHGFWRNADWLLCRDGKWRPVEPGTFPLANGASARVGRLRAYGNAICVETAREWIEDVMGVI